MRGGWVGLLVVLGLVLLIPQQTNAACIAVDGTCEVGENILSCSADCSKSVADARGDGHCDTASPYDEGCDNPKSDCGICEGNTCFWDQGYVCTAGTTCCPPGQSGVCTATCTSDQGWGEACTPPPGYPSTSNPEGWKNYYTCSNDGCQFPTCKYDCTTPMPAARPPCQEWRCTESAGWHLVDKTRGTYCQNSFPAYNGRCDGAECERECENNGMCASASAPQPPYTVERSNTYDYCPSATDVCWRCTTYAVLKDGICQPSCNAYDYECVNTVPQNADIMNSYACLNDRTCIRCNAGYTFNETTQTCQANCVDVNCAVGTFQCNGTKRQQCVESGTCQSWSTLNDCASQGLICSNGACTLSCTPKTKAEACGTNTCGSVSDGCGGTLSCGTCATTCTGDPGVCATYGITISQTSGGAALPATKDIMLGTSIDLYPSVTKSPTNAPATTLKLNGQPFTGTLTTVDGTSVGAIEKSFTAFVTATQVAAKSITINIYCNPGDTCYCNDESNGGCIIGGNRSATTKAGHCAAGTCGYCASGYVYDKTTDRCVKCYEDDKSQCPADALCQTPTCTNNLCGVINLTGSGREGLCKAPSACEMGACVGCTISPNSCQATKETVTQNSSGGVCKTRIETLEKTTPNTCSSAHVCVPNTPTYKSIKNETVNAPNGESCGPGKGCLDGSCVHELCVNSAAGYNAVDWPGNHSVCNSVVNLTDCVYEKPYPQNQECSQSAAKDGYCTAEDTCTLKCSSVPNIPGCSASIVNNAQVRSDRACPLGQLCYACNEDYVFKEGKCVLSEFRLTFSTTPLVAQTNIIVTPELTKEGRPESNGNHKYRFMITTSKTNEFFDTYTLNFPEPGDQPVTLTTLEAVSGAVLASTSRTLTITCPAGNSCCPANSNAYLPDGTSCQEDGEIGVCKDKRCVLGCVDTGKEICDNGKDDNCDGKTDCRDSACYDACGGLACDAGQIVCDRACTDIKENNLNCGECGKRCRSNEQCQAGACVEVLGCDVICNTDEECGRGMICINPGSCDKSYCAPATVVEANQSDIASIMEKYTRTFKITHEINGDELQITVINLAPVPLRNFTLTANIPKDIAQSASDLGASERFAVIKEDPVIAFNFGIVNARQQVVIDLPGRTDPAYAKSVQVTGTHDPISDIPVPLTQEVTITSNLVKDGNRSRLLLGINPHAELYGVRVPVEIPKCIAMSAAELDLSGDYEIIQDDPLVVWTFDELTSKETIEISIDGDVTENCKDGLTAFAVADLVDRPVNPWIPLLIIPVIGVILVTFSRFHSGSGAQERLSKKEFASLAREQGRTEQEIEESWKEYERKF